MVDYSLHKAFWRFLLVAINVVNGAQLLLFNSEFQLTFYFCTPLLGRLLWIQIKLISLSYTWRFATFSRRRSAWPNIIHFVKKRLIFCLSNHQRFSFFDLDIKYFCFPLFLEEWSWVFFSTRRLHILNQDFVVIIRVSCYRCWCLWTFRMLPRVVSVVDKSLF